MSMRKCKVKICCLHVHRTVGVKDVSRKSKEKSMGRFKNENELISTNRK